MENEDSMAYIVRSQVQYDAMEKEHSQSQGIIKDLNCQIGSFEERIMMG